MIDGLTPILVSMAAIFGLALVLVAVVAIRAQLRHEGSARDRIRHRAEQRRAHAAGKPVLFLDAARRQRPAGSPSHIDTASQLSAGSHAGAAGQRHGRHEKAAS